MTARETRFAQRQLTDLTPLPASIPAIKECGTSSAPLMSASFFIGARCRAFNDDYMRCKTDALGRGELECMKEGRKVTRCAKSVVADITSNCLDQFRKHWACLEENNQDLCQCRRPEQQLNACVFEKLGMRKEIPGAPPGDEPVHLRMKNRFGSGINSQRLPEPKY